MKKYRNGKHLKLGCIFFLNTLYIQGEADAFALNFQNTINDLYCKAFSLKTKLVSEKHYENRWITPEIISLLNAKSEYFNLFRLNLISADENNRFKNRVTNLIRI